MPEINEIKGQTRKGIGHSYFQIVVYFLILALSTSALGNVKSDTFYITPLSEKLKTKLTSSSVWKSDCPVSLNDLKVVSVSYYDLLNHVHRSGKIILHKSAANAALNLFRKLYLHHFPLSNISTLVHYKGDWQQAEEDNVTYGFICKSGLKKEFTPESYGNVITLNPVLNPEISLASTKNQSVKVEPMAGIFSINRRLKLKGMSESVEKLIEESHFKRLNLPEDQLGWKKFIFQEKDTAKKNDSSNSTLNYYLSIKEDSTQKPIFTEEPLSETMKKALKKNKLWEPDCPVPLERLSLLTLSYYDFDGKVHTGNLVVFDGAASYFLKVFKELYQRKFPLEEMVAVGDKESQTIVFNCRSIVGGGKSSLHSYGLAVDINISRNPYMGAYKKDKNVMNGTLIPFGSKNLSYINRSRKQLGMNEAIIKTMMQQGFIEWGGNWEDRVDYMHFQVPRNIAENMVYLDKNSAQQLMELVIRYPEAAKKMSTDQRWNYLYQLYPKRYISALGKYFSRLKTEKEITVINLIYLKLVNE